MFLVHACVQCSGWQESKAPILVMFPMPAYSFAVFTIEPLAGFVIGRACASVCVCGIGPLKDNVDTEMLILQTPIEAKVSGFCQASHFSSSYTVIILIHTLTKALIPRPPSTSYDPQLFASRPHMTLASCSQES